MTPAAIDLARDFIARWEGLSLKAYKCLAGVWTIGYGNTHNVHEGDVVTEEEALDLLEQDMHEAIQCVDQQVDVDLTDEQYAALISFAFNVGCSAFTGSTLLRLLNQGSIHATSLQFLRWNKAGGKPVQGLTNRRMAEMALFNEGVA